MSITLVDNTVLSNFAHVQRCNLLAHAFGTLVVPAAVLEELAEGERIGRLPKCDWSWLRTVAPTQDELEQTALLRERLGAGEAMCIAIARQRGGLVLTDDRDARRVAHELEVPVSGTLGALVNLVDAEVLTLENADQLLTGMIKHGYRSPINSLSEILND